MRDASATKRHRKRCECNILFHGAIYDRAIYDGSIFKGTIFEGTVLRRDCSSARSSRRLRSGFASLRETTLHVYDSLRQRVHKPHGALARRAHVVIAQAIDPVQVHQRSLERVAQKV